MTPDPIYLAWGLEGQQFPRDVGQDFTPRLGNKDVILDAHAREPGDIGTGFHRENHSGREEGRGNIRSRLRHTRIFMDVETETVTSAVTERGTESMPFEDITRGGIDGGRGDTGTHRCDGRLLRFGDRVVDPARFGRNGSDRNGTRQVRAIPVEHAAKIDDHEIAGGE